MKYMSTDWDFPHIDTPLELFKTNNTFILFKLIYPFIKFLFFKKLKIFIHSVFLSLNLLLLLFLCSHLIHNILLKSSFSQTNSNNSYQAYTYEDSHKDKEYKCH